MRSRFLRHITPLGSSQFTSRLGNTSQAARLISTQPTSSDAVTPLVKPQPMIALGDLTNITLNTKLSLPAAHTIYTATFNSKNQYLKQCGTHKQHPAKEKYPGNPTMQIAFNKFLAQNEQAYSNVAVSILGPTRTPITRVVVDTGEALDSVEAEVTKLVDNTFPPLPESTDETKGPLEKKRAEINESLAAINHVLGTRFQEPTIDGRKQFIEQLVASITARHSGASNAMDLFLDDIAKPEIGLPNDSPLLMHRNPRYFIASQELTGYTSLVEIADREAVENIFHIGPNGETRIKSFTKITDSSGEVRYKPYDVPVTGRIEADKTRLFLGERDPNPHNTGGRFINGAMRICLIDFDSCGASMPFSAEDLAFSAPHSVVEALIMPSSEITRIKRRAIVKHGIFTRIGNFDPVELSSYFDAHFDEESHRLFGKEIKERKDNLLHSHKEYKGAARIFGKACASLGIETTEKSQSHGRGV